MSWRRWLPAIVYTVLIFLVSSIPSLKAPGGSVILADKLAHLIEYGLLGVLLYYVAGSRMGRTRWITWMLLIALGGSIGALDEVYQSFIPGRDMSVYDWYADVAGVTLGLLVMSTFYPAAEGRS
jgi:VanZ family protein